MNNLKLDGRTIGIGLLILVAALIFLPTLFNRGDTSQPPVEGEQVVEGDIILGQPVLSASVDRDGCPVRTAAQFDVTDSFYVVAPNSDVPGGTSIFVRLYHEGAPIEDSPEITANQDYRNTCINFVFEPVNQAFAAGEYEAQFFINGNAGESIHFNIR